jgi:hypothetical protein
MLLCACSVTLAAADNSNMHVDAQAIVTCAPARMTFRLPHYWEVLPDAKLAGYREQLREMFPQRAVPNYVMAAQRKALLSFSMPYLLVELDSGPMPSLEQVEQEALAFAANIQRAYVALHRSNLFGEVNVMDAFYDTQQHVIIGSWDMYRARDNRRIAALNAIFPFRGGFVRCHFFLPAAEQDRYLPDVEMIVDSLTFEPGFEYVPIAASGDSRMKYTLYTIVVVLGAVWVGMRFMLRGQKRR